MIGIGTASVSHQRNTHERAASMFRLERGPSSSTKKKMSMHANGPEIMCRYLLVRSDFIGKRGLCIVGSDSGRRGVLGSSVLGEGNALVAIAGDGGVLAFAFSLLVFQLLFFYNLIAQMKRVKCDNFEVDFDGII